MLRGARLGFAHHAMGVDLVHVHPLFINVVWLGIRLPMSAFGNGEGNGRYMYVAARVTWLGKS